MNFKTILLGIFLISLTFKLHSQEKLVTGINSGLTYSNLRGNNFIESFESELNYIIGISIDYKVFEKMYLSADLNYERKSIRKFYPKPYESDNGAIGCIGCPTTELKFQTLFQYISIPLILKYYINNDYSFYFNGGVYFSYLLDIKNIDDGKESDLDFNDSFKKIDAGITFGFGYNFKINNNNSISIELRDNYGIVNLSKYDQSNFNSTKTNSINLI